MVSDDAIFWKLLVAIQAGLQNDLTFLKMGDDTTPDILPSSIVIRKTKREKANENNSTETLPGLLIVPSMDVAPPTEGTNVRDDVQYHVLIQIVANDNNSRLKNLRSYLKWQEQVRKYLNNNISLLQSTDCNGDAMRIINASQVDVVDEKRWVEHRNFVGGIQVTITTREVRGIT